MRRRGWFVGVAGLLAAPHAFARSSLRVQSSSPILIQMPTPSGTENRLWFDPTQLPSFTGVVDRYLVSPSGRVDRLLLREGPQVILPEGVFEELRGAVPPGHGIVVWGVRARRAPVITMLAWGAREGDPAPRFVERPAWGPPRFVAGSHPVDVAGEVVAPLYTSQGEVIGAILQDGMVVRVPPAAAAALGDRLEVGRSLAATGLGVVGPMGRAVDAERIGENPGSLGPLPGVPGPAR